MMPEISSSKLKLRRYKISSRFQYYKEVVPPKNKYQIIELEWGQGTSLNLDWIKGMKKEGCISLLTTGKPQPNNEEKQVGRYVVNQRLSGC